ncbi:hypothetical protein EXS45_02195, partial [Candidatus Nomurabacteria bacterium]|nr:hypothetical protein [Candidatus Nomurabacteria bacterium]
MKKTLIHVKVDASLKVKAEQLAERLGVPLSVVIKAVLKKFVSDGSVEIKEYSPGPTDLVEPLKDNFKVPSVEQYTRAFKKLLDKRALKS